MVVAVALPSLVRADPDRGISRVRRGRGFSYVRDGGRPVRDAATLGRIRALAIPPAWTHVVIAASPAAHIQAVGRDARGRKQYRYHARWIAMRDAAKYERLIGLCEVLPRVRAAVDRDLRARGLPERRVVAALVALLETCQLRVGNDEYARANGSYGATTLRDRHAHIHGDAVELVYRGKAGVVRHVRVGDRRLTRVIRACRALPGARLFQYVRDDGRIGAVTSADVNAYIHAIAGVAYSAKDFRTWAATLSAASLLCAAEPPDGARARTACVAHAIATIAARLGHTPAVCRASYVHPRLIEDFTSGRLAATIGPRVRRAAGGAIDDRALRAIEPTVAAYLRGSVPRSRPA